MKQWQPHSKTNEPQPPAQVDFDPWDVIIFVILTVLFVLGIPILALVLNNL